MIVDIYTATQTIADGVPTSPSWTYKSTYVVNWSPIGWEAKMQMGVGLGGERYPADSRLWLEHDADIVAGNKVTENSGASTWEVLSVFPYEDHKEAELRIVTV